MDMHENTHHDRTALFRAWLQEHAGLIYRVTYAFAPAEVDRDDLTQEVLLQLWVSMSNFDGKSKPSTWIYRLALNTALAWKRKEKRRSRQTPLFAIEDLPDDVNRVASGRNDELLSSLHAVIRALPKTDAALVMMHLDDLSYREMAEILGISVDNVGVKLNRAKKALANLMKGGDL